MPYKTVEDIPEYVNKKYREVWLKVFNSSWEKYKDKEDVESIAFRIANGVVKKLKSKKQEDRIRIIVRRIVNEIKF